MADQLSRCTQNCRIRVLLGGQTPVRPTAITWKVRVMCLRGFRPSTSCSPSPHHGPDR